MLKGTDFVSTLNIIASQFNCNVSIDHETKKININGDKENIPKCFIAFENLMTVTNGVTEVDHVKDEIKVVKDKVVKDKVVKDKVVKDKVGWII